MMSESNQLSTPRALDQPVADAIFSVMTEGYEFAKKGETAVAGSRMQQAWDMIPEPKLGWDISTIAVLLIAKFYRSIGDYTKAHEWADRFLTLEHLPGDGAPFILKGSIYYEAGDLAAAREWLKKGLEVGRRRAFSGEDPKYLRLVTEPR